MSTKTQIRIRNVQLESVSTLLEILAEDVAREVADVRHWWRFNPS